MRTAARRLAVAKMIVIGLIAACTMSQAMTFAHQQGSGTGSAAASSHTPGFKISGSVKGLYPGVVGTLKLKVVNPNGFAIVVRQIKASVSPVAGCPKGMVKVKSFKGKRRISGHRSAKVKLKISMKASAPDACQGGKFGLTYRGKAVKA
jgi:hypothetical protein